MLRGILLNTIVSASILSADLANLQRDIDKSINSGCEYIHFDVMDGVFVNNISYGIPVLKSVRKCTDLVLDVHLMIIEPLKYVKDFSDSGADIITFHYESNSDVATTIKAIRKCGVKVGMSIKPGTSAEEVLPYLNDLDMVLVMTVEPGFGGQGFIESTLDKIKTIRKYIDDNNLDTDIEVDGGINAETAVKVKQAGANILVAGSYLFNAENMSTAVKSLL